MYVANYNQFSSSSTGDFTQLSYNLLCPEHAQQINLIIRYAWEGINKRIEFPVVNAWSLLHLIMNLLRQGLQERTYTGGEISSFDPVTVSGDY